MELNSIGDYVFNNCLSLKQVEILPSLTYLGVNSFGNCISLKKIFINPKYVSFLNQAGIGINVQVIYKTDKSNCLIF